VSRRGLPLRVRELPKEDRLKHRLDELKKELTALVEGTNGKLRQLEEGIRQMQGSHAQVAGEGLRLQAQLEGRIAEVERLMGPEECAPCAEKDKAQAPAPLPA
jgi:hypothetical protein